jgi:hypothetical protein
LNTGENDGRRVLDYRPNIVAQQQLQHQLSNTNGNEIAIPAATLPFQKSPSSIENGSVMLAKIKPTAQHAGIINDRYHDVTSCPSALRSGNAPGLSEKQLCGTPPATESDPVQQSTSAAAKRHCGSFFLGSRRVGRNGSLMDDDGTATTTTTTTTMIDLFDVALEDLKFFHCPGRDYVRGVPVVRKDILLFAFGPEVSCSAKIVCFVYTAPDKQLAS